MALKDRVVDKRLVIELACVEVIKVKLNLSIWPDLERGALVLVDTAATVSLNHLAQSL